MTRFSYHDTGPILPLQREQADINGRDESCPKVDSELVVPLCDRTPHIPRLPILSYPPLRDVSRSVQGVCGKVSAPLHINRDTDMSSESNHCIGERVGSSNDLVNSVRTRALCGPQTAGKITKIISHGFLREIVPVGKTMVKGGRADTFPGPSMEAIGLSEATRNSFHL